MKAICIIFLFTMQNVCSNGSKFAKKLSALNPDAENVFPAIDDFPEMEYPQSVLEPDPFFFKSTGVLDPFTDDVKSMFKSIVETSKKEKDAPSTTIVQKTDSFSQSQIEQPKVDYLDDFDHSTNTTSDTEDEETVTQVQIEQSNVENVNQSTNATLNMEDEETENIQNDDQEASIETVEELPDEYISVESYESQIETPIQVNDTDSSERRKRSATSSESLEENDDYLKNTTSTQESSSTSLFSSAESILPRPPLASDDGELANKENSLERATDEEDMVHVPVCEEHCAIEKANSTEEMKDL